MFRKRDDGVGCDDVSRCGGGIKNTVTIVTTDTVERRKSQWGIPAGGDLRQKIQPEPIDFFSRKTLADIGKAAPFLLPNGECNKV